MQPRRNFANCSPTGGDEDFQTHIDKGPDYYWTAWSAETLAFHARLLAETEGKERPLSIRFHKTEHEGATEITICTLDHAGLFSRLAGSIAVAGANIVNASGYTLLNGYVIDTFWVQNTEDVAFKDTSRLLSRIEAGLAGEFEMKRELNRRAPWPQRTRVFRVAPQVLIDNKASATHTVIEVAGRDRPGFLNRVGWELTKLGLQISVSRISTYGDARGRYFLREGRLRHEGHPYRQAEEDPREPARGDRRCRSRRRGD